MNTCTHTQQSDEDTTSRTPQSLATPTPPSTGSNGQVPTILTSVTQTAPSTLPPPTTWTTPVTLTTLIGQVQTAVPNNAQYQQTQTTLQPTATIGITTFALANPLQALQNIRSVQQSATVPQLQYTPSQQTYRVPSVPGVPGVPAPTQPVIPSLVQPAVGGVYHQQPYQVTQTAFPVQVKTQPQQQPYPLIPGQTGTIQQPVVGFTAQTGQFPSLIPGAGVMTQASTVVNSQLSRQAFTSPYHQSSIPAAKSTLSTMLPPQQQLHQNTAYPSYTTQNVSYLPPVGLQTVAARPLANTQVGGVAARPLANTQVCGASAPIGSHMMTGTQAYPPQGVRGHTPTQNKPGWGMR